MVDEKKLDILNSNLEELENEFADLGDLDIDDEDDADTPSEKMDKDLTEIENGFDALGDLDI